MARRREFLHIYPDCPVGTTIPTTGVQSITTHPGDCPWCWLRQGIALAAALRRWRQRRLV